MKPVGQQPTNSKERARLNRFDVTTTSGFLKELLQRIKDVDVPGLGAQLAFFFLLSIFPLLIFLVTLLPYLSLSEEQIFSYMQEVVPGEVYVLIESTLQEILTSQNTGLLSFGILATIWSASLGMDSLIKSLNTSYKVTENRPLLIARGMSILMTILLILILIIALALPVFGEQLGLLIFSFLGLEEGFLALWSSIRFTIPTIITFVACAIIYWLAPNVKMNILSVLGGAAFAAIGWLVISYLFSIYISNFGNFSATYGSIGGVIILMLWLYISAMVLIIGGQINAVMKERRHFKKKAS
ncbi:MULTISPECIES: YihY/virulence factor BrkB family protein [Planococcus]|uniref:Ribonuclease n=1 Tax=Planococcus faecalis TaxID=1598147 RepID=A0ABM6IXV4_9BACL|nr:MULTISPECIES: YihY/virulence factor BrkB family protein [Planococcus]AQU81004.1 ribonuclease [Planococcus faecalis]MDJ0332138.1 YihY/virulence factor BrkB family protein [Planococcus sp. S3-L1]OHX54544.1 ribonuclease [Planococcus faecalis]